MRNNLGLYVLDNDKKVTMAPELIGWALLNSSMESRRVALDVVDGVRVSTVFLTLEHGKDEQGRPLLFETLAQNAEGDEEYLCRFATWDEAVAGHKEVMSMFRKKTMQDVEIGKRKICIKKP